VYDEANRKLDERIRSLTAKGVDVNQQVQLFKALRTRAAALCLSDAYLIQYREFLKAQGLPQHPSENKLRDVEERFFTEGHAFSFNGDILLSFDICGPCESHAMLLSIQAGISMDVDSAHTLSQLLSDPKHRSLIQGNVNFVKCPNH
jgi:hypothetical protein